MEQTIIDKIYSDNKQLIEYLIEERQVSFISDAENNFKKNLLLSIASFFENIIINILIKFVENKSQSDTKLISFIKSKALKRQYHQLFDWDSNTANRFFSWFGEDFKNQMRLLVNDDEKLNTSIKSFLEIGKERNRLVHQNFGEIYIEKTADEIYELYKKSLYFIDMLEKKLNE